MIGDNIKRQREKLGLTQEQLAADPNFGINANTLASYERNGREPRIETIARMAKYFGVSSDYLIGLTDYETPESYIAGKSIPLSDAALGFLSNCSGDLLETIDWILSAPSAGQFLAALHGYIVEPDGTEIPDKYLPLLDHLNRTMSDTDFLAFVSSWNWDGVEKSMKVVVNEAREKYQLEIERTKRGRPKKRGPYKKRKKQLTDMPADCEGSVDNGNSPKKGG